ncbi:flavin monoamine oxidase family protein [Aureimonas endophytica]|uniref:flavin monoamine oxidase family protein n=1 Tax=Aureimonas endophytica TaxID=2027858 RepID=UPI001FCEDECE|nr:NAD(P)/FAD-dependent oxidoreductase [Aureimonas endophytica]
MEVLVLGAGAAGIGAGRALRAAGIDVLLVEARDRLGGRALTRDLAGGTGLDLGCGWLHSADRNPLAPIVEALGFRIDRSRPPWARNSALDGLSEAEFADFQAAQADFEERLATVRDAPADAPVAAFFEAGNRWNGLMDAISTYYSGAKAAEISAKDLDLYEDSGVNWRVVEGYGRAIAAHGADLPVALGTTVEAVDHAGNRLRIETTRGSLTAERLIVTLPTRLLAEERVSFRPGLPDKAEAAASLPLGLAEKLYLRLERAEEFDADSRVFGATDRADTAAYHLRPFGRPLIECYFGGPLTAELAGGGEAAFFDFARAELVGRLGGDFARRIAPLPMHLWQADPFAGGSYSYARPGAAAMRARLAEPVENRVFFAGEAVSKTHFSTAHGAYLTGQAAAEAVIASFAGGDPALRRSGAPGVLAR